MVQIHSLQDELRALGLLQESKADAVTTKTETKPDGKKLLERKQVARKLRSRIEGLKESYSPKKSVVESKKDPARDKIQALFEELEELTDEPVEPEGDKAQRIMKDVAEIASSVMKKYGGHDEVKEVFEALCDAAGMLGKRMSEANMDEATSEKEVKKVVAELVDALEWLLEEFEPVTSLPLQGGDAASPSDRAGEGGLPDGTEPLPAQPGAGAPIESR